MPCGSAYRFPWLLRCGNGGPGEAQRQRGAVTEGMHQSLPCVKGGGSAFGAPGKPSVSGFAGERRSSGATALFALKAETKDAELVTTKAPWRVFLHYLSSREERWCPRRALDDQCGKIIRNNAPGKPSVSGFTGERRSSGMSELLPSRQNERYGACDDEGIICPKMGRSLSRHSRGNGVK